MSQQVDLAIRSTAQRHFSTPLTRAQQLRVDRARYSKLEDHFRIRVQRAMANWEAQTLSSGDLIKWFSRELYQFQLAAFVLGRRSGGDLRSDLTVEERNWLHGQHSQELKWFRRFITNGPNVMPARVRADLYALGSFSIYCYGYVLALPADKRWHYRLSPAEHCQDCVRKARLSAERGGLTRDELLAIGLPSTKCACGHRCRCFLEEVEPEAGSLKRVTRKRSTSFNWLRDRM